MKFIYNLCMIPAFVLNSCNRKGEHEAKYSNPLSFDTLYSTATSTTKLTGEAADRIAIRTFTTGEEEEYRLCRTVWFP